MLLVKCVSLCHYQRNDEKGGQRETTAPREPTAGFFPILAECCRFPRLEAVRHYGRLDCHQCVLWFHLTAPLFPGTVIRSLKWYVSVRFALLVEIVIVVFFWCVFFPPPSCPNRNFSRGKPAATESRYPTLMSRNIFNEGNKLLGTSI